MRVPTAYRPISDTPDGTGDLGNPITVNAAPVVVDELSAVWACG
jgi:hypothetical protein